ncbi:MAG: tRNA 2-thiouridine(34) synthase MnmA, partial [Akkermansiaceae bacterium]|nr:tRNA 2-thiouridine(34) synthase MnmA [Akkermansiaceae bacterium]
YTLGQRKGHGVASPREGMAYVVVGKDPNSNRLIVGWDEEATPGLYASTCTVTSVSSIAEAV